MNSAPFPRNKANIIMASMMPTFGFGSNGSSDASDTSEKSPQMTAPPAIPWDSIVKDEVRGGDVSNDNSVHKLTRLHDKLMPSIDQPEAKDFLTALVFLATRDNVERLPVSPRR